MILFLQDSKTCELVPAASSPGTKKSECFLKVLKGQDLTAGQNHPSTLCPAAGNPGELQVT